jgi:predicted acylesterase/phospholipase RssA/CRP-like cAMP-binding protein
MESADAVAKAMLIADISRLPWTQGLEQHVVEEIADHAEFLQVADGEFVHRAGQPMRGVYFLTRGRVSVTVLDLFGKTLTERSLGRGQCIGLFAVADQEDSAVDAVASEPASILRLGADQLYQLAAKHRAFQFNLFRLASSQVRQLVNVDRQRDKPSAVAIVHHGPRTRGITSSILERLVELGEEPCVASDHRDWMPPDGVLCRSLLDDSGKVLPLEATEQQLRAWSQSQRVIVDVNCNHDWENLIRLLRFADTLLWCVSPTQTSEAMELLKRLQETAPGWREKICLVWLLEDGEFTAPFAPGIEELCNRSFKVSFTAPVSEQGSLLNRGVERIVHHLRGIQIGLALGGGAARGMAHLGVLKTLENNGIFIDMLAGTSAGAMTGVLYAYGLEVDHNIRCFMDDLRLPRLFRLLPGGGYWYLLYKYRRGQFDSMLRKYLGDAHLSQLAIPTYTVTVDLVKGGPVVRADGDAVRSILESINLPGLSKPLLGEREALVDGGLVNNIPADVLVEKGCNFVIASSVTASLEKMFSGIHSERGHVGPRKPSTLQVLLRGHLVQSHNMNAVGVQPADVVISPDVTGFDLSEFERTDEMAQIGEQAGELMVPKIWQMLSKLDPQLFPVNADRSGDLATGESI